MSDQDSPDLRGQGLDLEAVFIAEGRPTWVEADEDGNVVHRTLEQAVAERTRHSQS